MAEKTGIKKSRKKTQWRNKIILLIVGIVVMLVLLFFVVFQVRYVTVSGNTKYSDDEIEAMVVDDIITGNTLLASLFRSHIDLSDIPFMDSAEIGYLSHNSIVIDVTEKKPVGYMYVKNNLVYFDKDGIVIELIPYEWEYGESGTPDDPLIPEGGEGIESGSENSNVPENTDDPGLAADGVQSARVSVSEFKPSLESVPLVTGIYVSQAYENQMLDVSDPKIFRTMLALIRMIEKYNILPESVEVSRTGDLILHYFKSVRVNLGEDEELEEKMTKLAAIYPELDGLSGVLHMEHYSEENRSFVFDRDE